MRHFAAIAVALTSLPAAAGAAAQDGQTVTVTNERRVCTRIELRGASRISYQRVCKTPTEWREQLGPDWRQVLAGNDPDEGLASIQSHNRDTLTLPGNSMSRNFGRPGGGQSGPQ